MVKREKKIGVGVSFPLQLLAWVDNQRKFDESRSAVVVKHLENAMAGVGNSLDTVILKEMIPVFVKNRLKVKLTPEQVNRIKELFGK